MKRFVVSCAFAASAAVMSFAPAAHAATVTANATIDLSAAINSGTHQWAGYAHPLDSQLHVTTGDHVVVNVDFTDDQTLTWNSTNGHMNLWLMLSGLVDNGSGGIDTSAVPSNQLGGFSYTNASVTLLNLTQGTQLSGYSTAGADSPYILGPSSSLFGNDNMIRTFSGFTFSFDANWNLSGGKSAVRDYSTLGYSGGGAKLITGAVAIPEPASLGLLALGGLALVRRRRA